MRPLFGKGATALSAVGILIFGEAGIPSLDFDTAWKIGGALIALGGIFALAKEGYRLGKSAHDRMDGLEKENKEMGLQINTLETLCRNQDKEIDRLRQAEEEAAREALRARRSQ